MKIRCLSPMSICIYTFLTLKTPRIKLSCCSIIFYQFITSKMEANWCIGNAQSVERWHSVEVWNILESSKRLIFAKLIHALFFQKRALGMCLTFLGDEINDRKESICKASREARTKRRDARKRAYQKTRSQVSWYAKPRTTAGRWRKWIRVNKKIWN